MDRLSLVLVFALVGFWGSDAVAQIEKDSTQSIWFGAIFGRHSENLSIGPYAFQSGFFSAINFEYPFSNAVYLTISLAYWQAKKTGVISQGEFIVDKSLKVGLGLVAFRFGDLMCSLNPCLGIEEMNLASSSLFSLEVSGKVNYFLFDDMLRLSSAISYQTAGEASVGGGYQYSFTVLTLGLSVNLTKF